MSLQDYCKGKQEEDCYSMLFYARSVIIICGWGYEFSYDSTDMNADMQVWICIPKLSWEVKMALGQANLSDPHGATTSPSGAPQVSAANSGH